MSIDEMVSKAELFAMNFIAKISDKNEQPARKQAYFLDNQEDLQKYMAALQKIVTNLNKDDQPEDGEDYEVLINRAESIINDLKTAIANYQKELVISDDTSEEDTTATLTHETISDAMKTNKTTQEISANMQAIAEQQKASQVGFNYALVCDGEMNMIAAADKNQLNESINKIVNASNYKNINLYQVTFTPVPLKKKTILTV
jgi:sugar-specific transcriptional regulator TrmB